MIEAAYKSHKVWQELESFEITIDQQPKNEFSHSLEKLIGYLRWILETSDHNLIVVQELNATTSELRAAMGHIPQSPLQEVHYNNILNQLAATLSRFPYARIQRIFRSEAVDALNKTEAEAVDLSSRISDLDSQLSAIELAAKKSAESAASSEETAQNSYRQIKARLDEAEAENSSRLSEFIAEKRDEFSLEKSDRADDFQKIKDEQKEKIGTFQTAFDLKLHGFESELAAAREEFSTSLSAEKLKAEKLLLKIDGVYQEAGQTLLAGGFAKASVLEMKQYADDAMAAKFAFAVAAAILAIFAFQDIQDGAFDWGQVANKLPISLILLAPAFYFAGLAAKHRKEAFRLRSLGLRVKAFDAFVNSSNSETTEKLREQVGPQFFLDPDAKNLEERGDLPIDTLIDLLKDSIKRK